MRFFEDIEVGQRRELGSFTFTADGIKKFAAQFDPQRFHLDEEEGRKSLLGGLAASAGKVALVRTTNPLAGACPSDGTIEDEVGYGSTANCFRGGGPTPAPGNATAVLRGSNGCTDTQNNASDFAAVAPNPRNSLSAPAPCSGTLAFAEITAEYLKLHRKPLSLCFDWRLLTTLKRYGVLD